MFCCTGGELTRDQESTGTVSGLSIAVVYQIGQHPVQGEPSIAPPRREVTACTNTVLPGIPEVSCEQFVRPPFR